MVERARKFSSSHGRGLLLLTLFAIAIGAAALSARQDATVQRMPNWVSDPVTPVLTIALIDAPKAPEPAAAVEAENDDHRTYPRPGQELVPKEPPPPETDALLAQQEGAARDSDRAVQMPVNVAGQAYSFVNPADPSGAVGPSHFVQLVNGGSGATVTIYNKSGTLTGGPFLLASLGGVGNCALGSGDPVVLYDRLANRWLLSEFADVGNHLCVYVSTTSDPGGTYFKYDFATPQFPDYPKYAVWPNAYVVTSNESTPAIYALDRNQMLAGGVATSQRFVAPDLAAFPFQALTPADFDGTTAPPGGSPAYLMRHRDDEVHNAGSNNTLVDFLEIWQLSPNFVTPGSSLLTGPTNIPVTSFDSDLCGLVSFSCFPQPSGTNALDPLREVIMYRLQYRNFGSHEALIGNFTVDTSGANRGGIRWFELRRSGGAWMLYQEGTYSPDATNRWMGGIAMDAAGNMLLAYSVSSASVSPGLRFTGRAAADAPGAMTTPETTIIAGAGSNGSNRWGDYHMLTIDPSDDCTFWFTGGYSPSSQWATRISRMKFDNCGAGSITSTRGSVAYGNYAPANPVVDSGERVTVNLTLVNTGAPTSNLVATLAATGGVTLPTAAQSYGAMPMSGAAIRQYRFTASGSCGGTVRATLQLQDGATSLGTALFIFTLGLPLAEAFDLVAAPALPAGWSTAATGGGVPWVTTVTTPFSSPNAAFVANPPTIGISELVTPAFTVPNVTSLLQFRNSYATESTFDGMVLEISINGGAFVDITTGGNTFLSGGYNGTISSSFGNPLAGRAAWTGNSAGYILTAINLPVSAQGQSVRLKWLMGSDASFSAAGVRVDSISVIGDPPCVAAPQVFADTLTAGATTIKGVHVTQLRGRIDVQRARFGLGAFPWTNPTLPPGSVIIQAAHIMQMRAALADLWGPAGLIPPVYTDPGLAAGTVVRAAHVNDIRNAVMAVENY